MDDEFNNRDWIVVFAILMVFVALFWHRSHGYNYQIITANFSDQVREYKETCGDDLDCL